MVGVRIEIFSDAYRVGAHRLVYIVVGVDINTAHHLDELARFRLAVGAGFIDVFTDKMEGHICNFRVFQIRDSDIRRYC